MLSIVPLLAGGVLLETGAGGSAPKHVEQAGHCLSARVLTTHFGAGSSHGLFCVDPKHLMRILDPAYVLLDPDINLDSSNFQIIVRI